MGMAYHTRPSQQAQSDGQTEWVYEIIEAYLRAFITYYYMQDDWDEWPLDDLAGAIPSTPRQEPTTEQEAGQGPFMSNSSLTRTRKLS
jgi:hypothetical protein